MRPTNFNKAIQRVNAATEVVSAVTDQFDLPIRVSQTISSASFFFAKKTPIKERLINGLQLLLSIAGMVLQVVGMIAPSTGIELALSVIDLMYRGTLIAAVGHAELSTDKVAPNADS